jgi:transposase
LPAWATFWLRRSGWRPGKSADSPQRASTRPTVAASNGKSKGKGNKKNGNPYLAWAYVEAAHFAIRYHSPVRRFYERKQARTHRVVALKAVAHKLARASYYVMRDQVPFQIGLAFG